MQNIPNVITPQKKLPLTSEVCQVLCAERELHNTGYNKTLNNTYNDFNQNTLTIASKYHKSVNRVCSDLAFMAIN